MKQPAAHADGGHQPVLLEQTLAALAPAAGQVAVDCTAGRGGHAVELARAVGPGGVLVLNDADGENLRAAAACVRALADPPRLVELRGNFVDVPRRLLEAGLAADCLLADLGFASSQIEDAARGMSFMRDGPLDMRFDRSLAWSAADLVNDASEEELAQIIRDYGQERQAGRIARAIIAARSTGRLETTGQLAAVVQKAAPPRRAGGINPATKTFQALRIAVNDELGSLRSLLESIGRGAAALAAGPAASKIWLAPQARLAIICFHSLEDRAVKQRFAELQRRSLADVPRGQPRQATGPELAENPRARSAKLRYVRMVARHEGSRPISS